MEFKIGDRVKCTLNHGVTGHGIIIDKIYSEAKKEWSYEVLLDNDECSCSCKESDLELDTKNITYEVKVDSYDGVVSAIVYECVGDLRFEITRGHGHKQIWNGTGFILRSQEGLGEDLSIREIRDEYGKDNTMSTHHSAYRRLR